MRRSALRKKRRRIFKRIHFVFFFLALVIIGAVALFLTDTFGLATGLKGLWTETRAKMSDSGAIKQIDGDYTVDAPGEVVQNMYIKGNLYLGPGIGDGSVELRNLTVEGSVLVQGGGRESVRIYDCTFAELKVHRPEGTVRLLATGETIIKSTVLETGAYIEEDPHPGYEAFSDVVVLASERVDLNGSFGTVRISSDNADVHLGGSESRIGFLTVTSTASGSRIYLNEDAIVDKFKFDAPILLSGGAGFGVGSIASRGTVEAEGSFNIIRVSSEAGRLVLDQGQVAQLIVNRYALNNSIQLEADMTVSYLELNEAVAVTGSGIIEKLVINAPGSTLEQIPLDIDFKDNYSVIIDGHEISTAEMLRYLRDHGDPYYASFETEQPDAPDPDPDPEPAPDPDPAPPPPSTPAIYTVVLNVSPEGTGSVTGGGAFEEGKEITIGASPRDGYEFVNWTVGGSEVTVSSQYSFTLNADRVFFANFKEIPAPDPIDFFDIADGLTPGKKMVIVTLREELDPREHRVFVAGTELPFSEAINGFRGEVDEADAERGKVEVTAR